MPPSSACSGPTCSCSQAASGRVVRRKVTIRSFASAVPSHGSTGHSFVYIALASQAMARDIIGMCLQAGVGFVKTLSARDFNQDVSAAKRAAADEPVIITDRGRPSHVLMSIDEYRRLTGEELDVVEWLSVDDDAKLDMSPARIDLKVPEL